MPPPGQLGPPRTSSTAWRAYRKSPWIRQFLLPGRLAALRPRLRCDSHAPMDRSLPPLSPPALAAVALVCAAGCGTCRGGPGPREDVAPTPRSPTALVEAGSIPSGDAGGAEAGGDPVVREIELQGFDRSPARAVLAYPGPAAAARDAPIVIALHGRGEAVRGPARGHRGWVDDYALLDAMAAVGRRRLTRDDYRGFVDEPRLAAATALLARAPLRPLIVVAPYLPDLVGEPPGSPALRLYGDWLAGPLLEATRRALPSASPHRQDVGIDGVSLGGMVALEVGFANPEVFGRVGAIQPAVRGRVDALARAAGRREGPAQRVRLLTSHDDPFLEVTYRLAEALRAQGVDTELVDVPGPHDYSFNRGPGSLELLLFHGAR